MSLDSMLTGIISQLPNLSGLILCILFQQGHIKMLYTRIGNLEKQNENLTGVIIEGRMNKPPLSSGLD